MGNKINFVMSGKYKDLKVREDTRINTVYIGGWIHVDGRLVNDYDNYHFIIRDEVNEINLIDSSRKISVAKAVAGAATLGVAGALMGVSKNEVLLEVIWRDNSKSLIKTNKAMYEKILSSFYLEKNRIELIDELEKIKKENEIKTNNPDDEASGVFDVLAQGFLFIFVLLIFIFFVSSCAK